MAQSGSIGDSSPACLTLQASRDCYSVHIILKSRPWSRVVRTGLASFLPPDLYLELPMQVTNVQNVQSVQ